MVRCTKYPASKTQTDHSRMTSQIFLFGRTMANTIMMNRLRPFHGPVSVIPSRCGTKEKGSCIGCIGCIRSGRLFPSVRHVGDRERGTDWSGREAQNLLREKSFAFHQNFDHRCMKIIFSKPLRP